MVELKTSYRYSVYKGSLGHFRVLLFYNIESRGCIVRYFGTDQQKTVKILDGDHLCENSLV